MSITIDELKKVLREARDHAYLGRYQESKVAFKKLVDSIEQEIMLNNIDRKMIDTWRKFENDVLAEKRMVESILGVLSGMTFENVILPVTQKSKFVYEEVEFEESR